MTSDKLAAPYSGRGPLGLGWSWLYRCIRSGALVLAISTNAAVLAQVPQFTRHASERSPLAPIVQSSTQPVPVASSLVETDAIQRIGNVTDTQGRDAEDVFRPSIAWREDEADARHRTEAEHSWDALLERLSAAERRIGELEATVPSEWWVPSDWVDPETGELQLPESESESNGGNGKPSVNVTGQLQVDFVHFNQSARNKETIGELENGAGFRRARLGAFGELYETTEYRVEFDFAGDGRPRFLDNWIAVKDIPILQNFIVGHFFEPFSLERYTPNRFITFMERSEVDVFAPARNTGVMFFSHTNDERVTWAFGAFRSESDVYGDSVNDSADWATTSHVTWLPYYDAESDGRYLLHVGASLSLRAIGDKEVQFRKRPENQLQAFRKRDFPVFADTGIINADEIQLLGTEIAWVHGPFSMQAEYVHCKVSRLDGPDPDFWGAYAYVSYFLTGENRSYSPASILGRFREGIFQRITPNTNAFAGNSRGLNVPRGIGAWEVAARVSHIDLNSVDIDGNSSTNVTLGVNWYLNPNTRFQWNYIRPFLYSREFGHSTADIVSMRFGFEW